ncbi:MAG TPA: glucose 1-dehydrogenase [Candidatus Saccharimonadales bacterium]|nr:glucose 1-dehydrogenase [Candidatus Saccharimonadales bacterium]
MKLKGKSAFVTGGTRGIGLAITQRFCQEGASVIIAGTENGEGADVAKRLRFEGYDVGFEPVDLTQAVSIEQAVGNAATRLSGLDILVNNAGVTTKGTIAKLTIEDWDRVQAVNLRAPVFAMRAAYPHLYGGSIINIASIAAIDTPFGKAAYAASKAGLIAASQVAAKEFASRRVRVNVIAPGLIETDMLSQLPTPYRNEFVADTPLRRVGRPEEIASAAAYFASDEAEFVTGQVLRIDGGLHFR